jgi:hypothetical protein
MERTAGPGCQRDEGEAAGSEGANQNGRHIPREDVTDARAGWAGEGWFRPTGVARPVGWLGQRLSGPQGQPGRNQENEFLN